MWQPLEYFSSSQYLTIRARVPAKWYSYSNQLKASLNAFQVEQTLRMDGINLELRAYHFRLLFIAKWILLGVESSAYFEKKSLHAFPIIMEESLRKYGMGIDQERFSFCFYQFISEDFSMTKYFRTIKRCYCYYLQNMKWYSLLTVKKYLRNSSHSTRSMVNFVVEAFALFHSYLTLPHSEWIFNRYPYQLQHSTTKVIHCDTTCSAVSTFQFFFITFTEQNGAISST